MEYEIVTDPDDLVKTAQELIERGAWEHDGSNYVHLQYTVRQKRAGASAFALARLEGVVVGYALIRGKRMLASFWVDPVFRRQGIGTQLVIRIRQHFNTPIIQVMKGYPGSDYFFEKNGLYNVEEIRLPMVTNTREVKQALRKHRADFKRSIKDVLKQHSLAVID